MKNSFLRFLLVSVLLLAAAPLTQAQDLGALRTRMEKRVSQIDALKLAGVLGENNRGFLEVRAGNDEGVAAAENADRTVVYAAIAKQAGASAEAVGKARAKKLVEGSAKGVWVQAENGQWAKK